MPKREAPPPPPPPPDVPILEEAAIGTKASLREQFEQHRKDPTCGACHNPHNNELGNFLRLPMREGALCNTCHQMDGWRNSAHALSGKSVPPTVTRGERLDLTSLADNACNTCHTPHGAAPVRPLWNRYTPIDAYRIYTSRSLDAEPGQPTGASKMCLSCHDGTIALGAVLIGLAWAVELVADKATKAEFPPDAKIGERVHAATQCRGMVTRMRGDVYNLAPCFVTEEQQIDRMAEILADAIEEVLGQ